MPRVPTLKYRGLVNRYQCRAVFDPAPLGGDYRGLTDAARLHVNLLHNAHPPMHGTLTRLFHRGRIPALTPVPPVKL